jgi:hypothetical protein
VQYRSLCVITRDDVADSAQCLRRHTIVITITTLTITITMTITITIIAIVTIIITMTTTEAHEGRKLRKCN